MENKPLSADAEKLLESAEARVVEAGLLAVLQASAYLDRFSGWLLAATGAAIALVLTNTESLADWTSQEMLRGAVKVLLLSAAFALVQKIIALLLDAHLAVRSRFLGTFPTLITESDKKFHGLPSEERPVFLAHLTEKLKDAVRAYSRGKPWYLRVFSWGARDTHRDLRNAARLQGFQALCAILQLLALVTAFYLMLLT